MSDMANVEPEQALSMLFTPVRVGKMALKNRVVATPTATGLAQNDQVTDSLKRLYTARARGGAGLIMIEPGAVDIDNPGSNLGLYDDKFIGGLRPLVEVAHSHDSAIGIQLIYYGRQWPLGAPLNTTLVAPSAIPWSPSQPVPKELTLYGIEQIVQKFVDGARRAGEAGFDVVELQAAHGYLISQFFSGLSNQRQDHYGGDLEGRTRFAVEIIRRIKQTVRPDIVLSARLNGTDNVPGGPTLQDMKAIASVLAEEGVDMISVSAGVYGSYPTIVPPYDMPGGCYVAYAEGIKSAVKVPVIVAGRITDPHQAEEILRQGKADLIGLSRPLVADPDWPNKAKRGEFDEIRKCLGCNRCLDSVDIGTFHCTVNPVVGRESESEIVPAMKPKAVMVVGGGLAGLEAARIAALRGHTVTLYEQSSKLGGQWNLATVPPYKEGYGDLIHSLSRQAKKAGVSIALNRRVTVETIEEKQPDVAVIATGALPVIPPIPGAVQPGILNAWDVLSERSHVKDRALIIGGNSLGLETADFLSRSGTEVTVVELEQHVGRDLSSTVRWHLLKRLRKKKIKIYVSSEVKEIGEQEVVVATDKGNETWNNFDNIILAVGTNSTNELASEAEGKVSEVYVIGDALEPRKARDAILDGNMIGREV